MKNDSTVTERSVYADRWTLDPAVTFLNHGSFGACPRQVLAVQQEYRDRMERQPVRFLVRELEQLLDEARGELGRFVGADPDELVFVPNATVGVNAVVRSLTFGPGDELLTTNQDYNACRNALLYAAERGGATAVTADVPFPVKSDDQIVAAVMSRVTTRTRLAMVCHVTSPTGIVWPIARIVRELAARGVDTLVDGAHAPAMLDLNIQKIGAAYYTGNCHKWLCAPKGTGFLHVRKDRRDRVRPTIISHGANALRTNRSRFLMEFDWTGTVDPTACLSISAAIRFVQTLMPGGLPALQRHNRQLALNARRMLCDTLGVEPPCPDSMIGSLAAVALPDNPGDAELLRPTRRVISPMASLQDRLWEGFAIEVPIVIWPQMPTQWVRISAQAYNTPDDYRKLCEALTHLLGREGSP